MARNSEPSTLRAVIYARYSSHAQNDQSIDGQLHDAYAFAERNGYTVIGEYIDRALTGTKDSRPDFQRMIRDAEKGQFQLVIVWKLDRFARNRYDSAIYKAKLKKSGVRVVSVMENLTDGPEGIILEGILESMAEYYSANLAENVRRGMSELVRRGLFPGGPVPLGYRVEDHHLVIDERVAPIVREMFRRYADGEGPAEIARDLNRRGYRTQTGQAFTPSSFKLVTNPAYIGQYTYGGNVIEGAADAMIDEETFRRANDRRTMNRRAPAQHKAADRYLLSGKAFCGHCGSPMIGESGRGKMGTVYHYYACAQKKKTGACRKRNEKKDFVERYVCEQTVRYILDPERQRLIAERVVDAYNREFNDGQVEALERRLRRIDADLNKLVDNLLDLPKSAREKIVSRMEQLDAEKAEAEADLAKARITAGIRITAAQVTAWLRSFAGGDLEDPDFRQKLIDTFVNSVYLYDDKLVIFYNLRGEAPSTIPTKQDVDSALESSDFEIDGVPPIPKSEPRLIWVHRMMGIVILR